MFLYLFLVTIIGGLYPFILEYFLIHLKKEELSPPLSTFMFFVFNFLYITYGMCTIGIITKQLTQYYFLPVMLVGGLSCYFYDF